ncbi:PREDICTED: uncharacterized protein LOC105455786 [Wasmannia auropunctata]|uniref:uncharacterized protein LOC105455786 n=1 Tax=Wasmannia auropunctata TaxID=64793 RepID=UPI0005F03767|nr:PREDICTED: uncharacterized protein LOC105455786 [Wasmannia auropunctata]
MLLQMCYSETSVRHFRSTFIILGTHLSTRSDDNAPCSGFLNQTISCKDLLLSAFRSPGFYFPRHKNKESAGISCNCQTRVISTKKMPLRITRKHVELASKWSATAMAYGTGGTLALLYFTDWKAVVTYIPFYNTKFQE